MGRDSRRADAEQRGWGVYTPQVPGARVFDSSWRPRNVNQLPADLRDEASLIDYEHWAEVHEELRGSGAILHGDFEVDTVESHVRAMLGDEEPRAMSRGSSVGYATTATTSGVDGTSSSGSSGTFKHRRCASRRTNGSSGQRSETKTSGSDGDDEGSAEDEVRHVRDGGDSAELTVQDYLDGLVAVLRDYGRRLGGAL